MAFDFFNHACIFDYVGVHFRPSIQRPVRVAFVVENDLLVCEPRRLRVWAHQPSYENHPSDRIHVMRLQHILTRANLAKYKLPAYGRMSTTDV